MLVNPGRSPAPLLRQARIEVRAAGPNVELEIGGAVLVLPYGGALRLAQWLRVCGKQAKRFVEDPAHWSAIAALDGVESVPVATDEAQEAVLADVRAALNRLLAPGQAAAQQLAAQRIRVRAAQDKVELHSGNTAIALPYEAALQVSQWLRTRGREAKRFAGNTFPHVSALAVLSGLKH